MALPTNRTEFADYCLRKLGAPVIEINVDPEQVDDRIDEALSYFWDYHFDGSSQTYYRHQITEEDVENKYIRLPDNIMGAVQLFPMGGWGAGTTNDMFSINYQIALNDMYTLTNNSLVPYYMTREKLNLMQEILVGRQPIRYQRHKNRLYIDMNWDKLKVGNYLIVEAYEVIDPEIYEDVWKDRWLLNYATALIKQQWGSNLTKFVGMQLPGAVTFNGERILSDAQAEIAKMQDEMISSYSMPLEMGIG